MANIHINPNTGETGPCHAKNKCRFGTNTPHYNSVEEARAAYEQNMQSQAIPAAAKKSSAPKIHYTKNYKLSRTLKVGGSVLVASIALSGCNSQSVHAATSELNKIQNNVNSASSQNNSGDSGTAGNSDSGTTDSSGVYFQGKPLKPSSTEVADAKANLDKLLVRNHDTSAEYNRAGMFGRSFKTGVVGRLEHRDITSGVFKNSAPQSRAVGGSFVDPYTGKTIQIIKGSNKDTDVDHIVPLKEATEDGASSWSQQERLKFANDPVNTSVVSSSANREKGDSDASQWLPSYQPAQCTYVVQQITVKSSYNLSVAPAEKQAMENVLANRCS